MRGLALLATFVLCCNLAWSQGLTTEDLVCKEGESVRKIIELRSARKDYGYQILYNRCEWRVNPYRNGFLRGKVTALFAITASGDSIRFDLHDSMKVDSVVWHGMELAWKHQNHQLAVTGTWLMGNTDSLSIYYHGKPDLGAAFGYYNYDLHETGPIVYTLSEPYGASYWWPCKQTLQDKIDSLDVIMYVPPSMKAGSNGKLVRNDSINDSTRVFHWKCRYPIAPYLVSFAVSNYTEFTEYAHFYNRPDSMPVVNYVFPQSDTDARKGMPPLLRVLRLYDSLVGNYPFEKEKYGHSQFTWGGGMEHQTMSSVVSFNFDLLAHELAHQWFGDKVTCGSWSDLWLNEGFATYFNALCYRYLRTHYDWLNHMREVRNGATAQVAGSVFARDTVNNNVLFSGNLRYNKGAFVLHMLRDKVGDSVFFGALRKYLAPSAHGYGFARTADLKQILETESGKNLDTFFTRWFIGEGYPILNIRWEQSGSQVKLNITQTQSSPIVPFFELKIPIRFRNDYRDTTINFFPNSNESTFHFLLPFSADSAEFDPEVVVLARYSIGGINLDKTKTGKFAIEPNPASDELRINPYFNVVTKVEIFDQLGRKVYESPEGIRYHVAEHIVVPISNLAAGTYVTRLHTSTEVNSIKFVKR